MSGTLITYSQKNKNEAYELMTISEKYSISSLSSNFIQELITSKGSNAFDRNYGTNFIESLGEQVNVYKIDFFVKKEGESLLRKYNILSASVGEAWIDGEGALNIKISLDFSDTAVDTFVDFRFSGTFTTGDIIEYS